jgi:hypothetical protein
VMVRLSGVLFCGLAITALAAAHVDAKTTKRPASPRPPVVVATPPPVFVPTPTPPPMYVPSPTLAVLQELPEAQRAKTETALQFAQLYSPADIVKANAMRLSRKTVMDLSANDAASVAMESRYPGVTVAAADAAANVVGVVYDREMPNVHQRLANIIHRYFSEPLAQDAIKFYASDTGRTVIRTITETADPAEIQKKVTSNPEAVVTKADIIGAVSTGNISTLTDDQIRELARFGASPAGLRLQRATPLLLEELTSSLNLLITQQRPEVQAAIMVTVADFQRADKKQKKK